MDVTTISEWVANFALLVFATAATIQYVSSGDALWAAIYSPCMVIGWLITVLVIGDKMEWF